jgi:hypothetical protein
MKEFVLIFRLEELPEANFPAAEMKAGMAIWEKWVVDEAANIAKDAPIVGKGTIEVRGIYSGEE